MLSGGKIVLSSNGAKNSNKYFCEIKSQGIELIEERRANLSGRGYFLRRRLNPTEENKKRAKVYLKHLKNKNSRFNSKLNKPNNQGDGCEKAQGSD